MMMIGGRPSQMFIVIGFPFPLYMALLGFIGRLPSPMPALHHRPCPNALFRSLSLCLSIPDSRFSPSLPFNLASRCTHTHTPW